MKPVVGVGVAAIAYTAPANIEVAKLTVVQKFADRPKEAKVIPIFVIIGCNEPLNLLSILPAPINNPRNSIYR
jgi:hypothetical protein